MAARVEEKKTKKKSILGSLPFTKTNYQIFGVGLFLLVVGYIALSQEPWDSDHAVGCCTDFVGTRILCRYSSRNFIP